MRLSVRLGSDRLRSAGDELVLDDWVAVADLRSATGCSRQPAAAAAAVVGLVGLIDLFAGRSAAANWCRIAAAGALARSNLISQAADHRRSV